MRLDKYLHDLGFGTRKDIDRLLRNGAVTVNGELARKGKLAVAAEDQVCVEGRAVDYEPKVTIMLNKPAGVVSAAFDPREQTVLDLLPDRFARMNVAPVGRLDKDTTGLLLLTNDGDYNHRLTHPRTHVPKTYLVHYFGTLPQDAEARCSQGIALSDFTTAPARLARLEEGLCRLTISEGKFHQVKRMLGALDCTVTALKRESIGGLVLDESLEPGQWRDLTAEERQAALEREG
jgi:16S rRNA pseudouridine516 synthase